MQGSLVEDSFYQPVSKITQFVEMGSGKWLSHVMTVIKLQEMDADLIV